MASSTQQGYPHTANERASSPANTVFVPFSEALLGAAGADLGELVPYQLEYKCVRLLDGTYEFLTQAKPLH